LRGDSVRRCPLLGEPLRGLLAVDASLRLSAANLESLLPKVVGLVVSGRWALTPPTSTT
jgi:hypothetical protein